ncbi:hypothetical protein JP09_001825 [Dehalogenimonas etheniformans]|uniref:Uncharacterized protein n=1 Tax=Dehalogenimonas etheniformans TaxID=1536648 RepID=A0A2P5P8M5_9CHLR|nr:hypothetical protein JP09_001825 [Dehalogenimonas etheniformans]
MGKQKTTAIAVVWRLVQVQVWKRYFTSAKFLSSGSNSGHVLLLQYQFPRLLDLFHTLDIRTVTVIEKGATIGVTGIMAETAVLGGDIEIRLLHLTVPPISFPLQPRYNLVLYCRTSTSLRK